MSEQETHASEHRRLFRIPEMHWLISQLDANGVHSGSSILDIGCDKGYFLDQCRRFGYIVQGVEPSESARAYCNQAGLDVKPHLQDISEHCDAITLWHVLEHFTNPQIEVVSDNSVRIKIKKDAIPSLIGKGGSTINEIEKLLHIHIDVQEKDSGDYAPSESGYGVSFDFSESKNSILFEVNKRYSGMLAELYVKDQYVTTARVARHGKIKLSKRSDAGKALERAAFSKSDIDITIKDS
ncbi:MAG: methyltransferase domain-containing protein [Nitrososphaeria archaeon]|nr:methyltransferase domain-containing protein [Nitrososphaeria archaeon]